VALYGVCNIGHAVDKPHGRVLLNKGDKPLTTGDMHTKLTSIWKTSTPWRMVPLGQSFMNFILVLFRICVWFGLPAQLT
jgi:hypothetical protein